MVRTKPQGKKRSSREETGVAIDREGGREPPSQMHRNGEGSSNGEGQPLSSAASACTMHCTVCEGDFATRLEWLSHLGELEHQRLARTECLEMWGEDQTMKECVVAVFCSFSLTYPGTVMDVLKRFSSGGGGRDIVTDFAWWPERPRVGFMQFESKRKVAEILKGLEASSAFVQDKLVQLKKATDFLQLEWKELLPPELSPDENPSSSVSSSNLSSPPLQSATFPINRTIPPSSTKPSLMYDPIRGEIIMKSSAPSSEEDNSRPENFQPTSIPFPQSIYLPDAHTPLQLQFNSVCKSIEIPDAECQHAIEIAKVIKQIFRKDHPSGEVIIFRNYYLRLRNTNSNVLLLFAYIKDDPSDPHGFLSIAKSEQGSMFDYPEFKNSLPGFKKKVPTYGEEGSTYRHKNSGFRFSFVTDPLAITEAYLCLLLQYLCTFDERVRPLFAIIYFWAKSRDVRIAEEHIRSGVRPSNLPEPVALEWLVILFLAHEGVIPTVREILQRPHKPLLVSGIRRDIGFSFDAKYASNWSKSRSPPVPSVNSDDFLVSVITLAQKFFHFYATNLEDGCWLLNPKDGEIIKREGTHCHKSKLTADEMDGLNKLQSPSKDFPKEYLIISDFRIYMLHPLYITRKLSFCVDTWTQSTCAKMKQTAVDLEEYLKSIRESDGGLQPNDVTLEAVLAGGQLESENVQFDLQCEMNQSLRTAIKTRMEQRKRPRNRNSESCSDASSGQSKKHKRKKF